MTPLTAATIVILGVLACIAICQVASSLRDRARAQSEAAIKVTSLQVDGSLQIERERAIREQAQRDA